jgi:hypothetical protein
LQGIVWWTFPKHRPKNAPNNFLSCCLISSILPTKQHSKFSLSIRYVLEACTRIVLNRILTPSHWN